MKRSKCPYWLILLVFLAHSGFTQNFVEIAPELGIDYDFTTSEYGGGVSFVDFNQDGLDDLTFATDSASTIRFHQNTGTGFQELTPLVNLVTEVKQVLWVDYDNDGELDLYVTTTGKNRLYRNNGDLELVEVTESVGLPDTALISYASTWFDYDSDGYLDLFTTYRTPEEEGFVNLYRNTGSGQFENFTIQAGLKDKGNSVLAMTSFDYNNDGHTDLFLAQDWEQGNQLLRNNGNGSFSDVSNLTGCNQKMNSMTATVGDYNGDGWLDIYVTNTYDGNILLRNNKGENFTEVSKEMNVHIRSLTFGSVFFDGDNDGDLELQVVGFQANYLFENQGVDQPYRRVDSEWGMANDKYFNNGLALGDYDNDGYLEQVRNSVTRKDYTTSKNTFWKNEFDSNHYLTVSLKGTISNQHAIGATLKLYSDNRLMIRRIATGESYASQHTYNQHFGLGETNLIDSLIIFWPSGNISKLYNQVGDQKLTINEPLEGCTDINSCNYNPKATLDNGTCRYPSIYMTCTACINDLDHDGVCDELEVFGCTDPSSCSYNPMATESDESCNYLDTYQISGNESPPAFTAVIYQYQQTPGSTYQWEAENGNIIIGHGTAEVTVLWHEAAQGALYVTETNKDDCQSEPVSLEVQIGFLLDVENQSFNIFPNPVKDEFNVEIQDQHYLITLQDMAGRMVLQRNCSGSETINISNLKNGIYILKVNTPNQTFTQKIRIEK
ncbi:MAG: FG-GAP-like repeat-containing protein [Marinoscillum sp.]